VLAGAQVVVHAAAETAGGFEEHERNSVGATRELLRAMTASGVRRLVHISSISVLRPPRPFWERQAEQTPLAEQPERLGPYTWGKCGSEALVAAAQGRGEIEARIIRPAALIDFDHLEMPGLLGRRLFGDWHLGLGRPGLPFAVCDVSTAAAVVAWCADRFGEAPSALNLFEPDISTRAQLLERFRRHGWHGRMVWTPISFWREPRCPRAVIGARASGAADGDLVDPASPPLRWGRREPGLGGGAGDASGGGANTASGQHRVGSQSRVWLAAYATAEACLSRLRLSPPRNSGSISPAGTCCSCARAFTSPPPSGEFTSCSRFSVSSNRLSSPPSRRSACTCCSNRGNGASAGCNRVPQ
jgi:hypothetical protein